MGGHMDRFMIAQVKQWFNDPLRRTHSALFLLEMQQDIFHL